jgi:hypothetical protein
MLGNKYVKVLSRSMKVLCGIFVSNRVSERDHFFFLSHSHIVIDVGLVWVGVYNFLKVIS